MTRPPAWWPSQDVITARIGDMPCQRPCGCYWDPVVFSHWPGYYQGCGGTGG